MKIRLVLCLSIVAAAGCNDDPILPAPLEPAPAAGFEIRYGADASVLAAPAAVDSAWSSAGQLFVAVTFQGDCGNEFSAVAPPAFAAGSPAALPVYLRHTAGADSCTTPQSRVLRFAVQETEALYTYQHTGALAPYVLRVIARAPSGELDSTSVAYSPTGIPETPASREAEAAAVHLGTALTAAERLQSQIQSDLAAIRSTFGPEIPELGQISLYSPWRTDAIGIEVDAATARAIASGTYHDWDALNAEFHVVAIDPGSDGNYSNLTLQFWTNWRTDKVAARYTHLQGVIQAARLSADNVFSSDIICVRHDTGKRMYLFRHSWGDCPSGCINNLFWYFSVTANAANYVGDWDPSSGGLLPVWWADARRTEASWFGTPLAPWDRAVQITTTGEPPTWSPDGSRIAYAVNTRTTSTIWSVAADGSDAHPVVELATPIQDLEWSRDGSFFLFGASNDLWTVPATGGGPTQLTADPASDRHPALSVDGTRIAFTSTRSGSPDIWVMPAAGGAAVRITTDPRAWEDQPAWSPDGSQIAYRFWYGNSAHATLAVIPSAGGAPRQLTFDSGSFDGSWDGSPAWSPDGATIAFDAYRVLDGNQPTRSVWLVTAVGGRLRWLTFPDGAAPAWSPDAARMAFVSSRSGTAGIWVLNLTN